MWYGEAATSGDRPLAIAHNTRTKPPTIAAPNDTAIQAKRRDASSPG